jgi:hypothetical protein
MEAVTPALVLTTEPLPVKLKLPNLAEPKRVGNPGEKLRLPMVFA